MVGKVVREASHLGRWLRSRFIRGGAILLYHRIAGKRVQNGCDPFGLCVSEDQFTEHLEVIRRHFRPVRLTEVLASTTRTDGFRPLIAITFDDGYADNLHVAKPLLERHGVPATVFVVSGSIGKRFWWDELTRCLLEADELPSNLELAIDGRAKRWNVDDRQPASRKRLLGDLYRILRPLEPAKRRAPLRHLREWSGSLEEATGLRRPMTEEEIRKLTADGLVEVGAHTVSHCHLASLASAQQADEIGGSKRMLESLTGRTVRSFSYPYGQRGDYDAKSIECLRQERFEFACTNVTDVVRPASSAFELPRLWVSPASGRVFESRVRRWVRF